MLRHRVTLTYEALAEGMTPDAFIERILKALPAPAKPLAHEQAQRAAVNG